LSKATLAASSTTSSIAFSATTLSRSKAATLLLRVQPGERPGPHLHLLRRLPGEAVPAHLPDRRPIDDLAARYD
jgi:hypothetical protein